LKTRIPKADEIKREWVVVDAAGQPLGRLATRVATILRGKHRPTFTPNLDTGDFVVVINADQVRLSGRKPDQTYYFSHSTHPGGSRFLSFREAMARKPEWVVRKTIWGMLPHGPLGRQVIRKLKVYRGAAHPHAAQKPTVLK
jgi:large subunit ribosomal protein L13